MNYVMYGLLYLFLEISDVLFFVVSRIFYFFLHIGSDGDFNGLFWLQHGELALAKLLNLGLLFGFIVEFAQLEQVLIFDAETNIRIVVDELYFPLLLLFLTF